MRDYFSDNIISDYYTFYYRPCYKNIKMNVEKRLKCLFLLKLNEDYISNLNYQVELMLNYIEFLTYLINYRPEDNKVFLAQYKISYIRILIIL